MEHVLSSWAIQLIMPVSSKKSRNYPFYTFAIRLDYQILELLYWRLILKLQLKRSITKKISVKLRFNASR